MTLNQATDPQISFVWLCDNHNIAAYRHNLVTKVHSFKEDRLPLLGKWMKKSFSYIVNHLKIQIIRGTYQFYALQTTPCKLSFNAL